MKPIIKNVAVKVSVLEFKYAKQGYGVLGLKYFKRLNYFKNSKNSCGFDPITGEGHSYGWYSLTKIIRRKLVLNVFGYSNQTSNHWRKVSNLLDQLKVPYICVEAPQGLQNLEICRDHTAMEWARNVVRNKYARKKRSQHWNEKRLQQARKIGLTFPKKLLDAALEKAESERSKRNERLRSRRISAPQLAVIK